MRAVVNAAATESMGAVLPLPHSVDHSSRGWWIIHGAIFISRMVRKIRGTPTFWPMRAVVNAAATESMGAALPLPRSISALFMSTWFRETASLQHTVVLLS